MAQLAKHAPALLIPSTQRELDRFLALDRVGENPAEVSLHEYFPVLVLEAQVLSDKPSAQEIASDYARPTGRWHVQVHAHGKPVGFARVLTMDTPRVVGYARSEIATDIDRVIDIVDSAGLPDSLYARIVEIPSFHIAALVLAPQESFDPASAYAVVYQLPNMPLAIEKFAVYPLPELLAGLSRARAQMEAERRVRRDPGSGNLPDSGRVPSE